MVDSTVMYSIEQTRGLQRQSVDEWKKKKTELSVEIKVSWRRFRGRPLSFHSTGGSNMTGHTWIIWCVSVSSSRPVTGREIVTAWPRDERIHSRFPMLPRWPGELFNWLESRIGWDALHTAQPSGLYATRLPLGVLERACVLCSTLGRILNKSIYAEQPLVINTIQFLIPCPFTVCDS